MMHLHCCSFNNGMWQWIKHKIPEPFHSFEQQCLRDLMFSTDAWWIGKSRYFNLQSIKYKTYTPFNSFSSGCETDILLSAHSPSDHQNTCNVLCWHSTNRFSLKQTNTVQCQECESRQCTTVSSPRRLDLQRSAVKGCLTTSLAAKNHRYDRNTDDIATQTHCFGRGIVTVCRLQNLWCVGAGEVTPASAWDHGDLGDSVVRAQQANYHYSHTGKSNKPKKISNHV